MPIRTERQSGAASQARMSPCWIILDTLLNRQASACSRVPFLSFATDVLYRSSSGGVDITSVILSNPRLYEGLGLS